MTSLELFFSTSWTGDRLALTANGLFSCVIGVASRSCRALPLPEVTLEHVGDLLHHPSAFSMLMLVDWSLVHLVVACSDEQFLSLL